VTNAEVRKLGILEVVKEERRKWLEDKLKDPEGGSSKVKPAYSSTRTSPNTTTALNVGSGLTARLLSKPPSRFSNGSKRRAQTDDGVGSSFASKNKIKGSLNHSHHKSRGVLLCGDVVPIKKRNGATGSATLWVKEKKAGLIWVLEEIISDIAIVELDEVGCVTSVSGSIEPIWGMERIRSGMDIKRLIPAIPKRAGTNTGALDLDTIFNVRDYTARAISDISIPIAIEKDGDQRLRISSFPHIAGIVVLNSDYLKITSCNTVVTSALFGQTNPDGLHINEILPDFEKLLHFMTDEDKIELKDGIVIPEHNFRRARSLLSMREGSTDAASVFLRPSGMVARHRDGSDVMVDVQMRVVKSGRPIVEENVIQEQDELALEEVSSAGSNIVYALWITYSRHLHTSHHRDGAIANRLSQTPSPCPQPISGQVSNTAPPSPDSPEPAQTITETTKNDASPTVISRSVSRTSTDSGSASPITAPRKKTISEFVVLEDMGQGAYGQVKLCRSKRPQGNKVVIKYVTKSRILVDTWTRDRKLGTVPLEIHVLDYLRRPDLKHPNIVEMSDFFEDDINYYIEMVPHGLPGMDLFDYIELRSNMEESESRRIFVQVAEAVYHLHMKAMVVHRDIKDENVILDGDQNIKLIDFGSAAYIKNGPFDVFVGTIGMFPVLIAFYFLYLLIHDRLCCPRSSCWPTISWQRARCLGIGYPALHNHLQRKSVLQHRRNYGS
jgi:protein-serine/threonine kinase